VLNSFEILPDRLIVYLWPSDRANFSFRFQPRFAMSAKSAASEVYDYYNPEARSVVAPVNFRVETIVGGQSSLQAGFQPAP
jgi:hypothetical protein